MMIIQRLLGVILPMIEHHLSAQDYTQLRNRGLLHRLGFQLLARPDD